ncbi:MAG: 5-carboxymethyl-2-hydroxymuconate Delta-isomerase [Alphaproteobacteria bacterium]
MPQISFEYSANLMEDNIKETLTHVHQILVEKLPTKLNNCKTRIIKYSDYLIGDGNKNNGFIHLEINILPGRNDALLDSIATLILQHFKQAFSKSLAELDLQISICIKNLPGTYYKLTE